MKSFGVSIILPQGFSDIAQPMIALTAKSAKWVWGEECNQSFEKLKQCLINPPILVYPDHTKTFYLTTDASLTGLGAVLSQAEEGEETRIGRYSQPREIMQ